MDKKLGVCGESSVCRITVAEPHFGEEPPISGLRGSGAVFFTGCPAHCFFCQNYQISQDGLGRELQTGELPNILRALVRQGVHNLNFVTPEHFWPHIRAALAELRAEGTAIPTVFNSASYTRPELVDEYSRWTDIFLLDYKFADPELAQRVLNERRYPDLALETISRAVELAGFLHPCDPEGRETARSGVLIRHLVLPGKIDNSLLVLKHLRENFGRHLPLSVMSQYRPVPACAQYPSMNRTLNPEEYKTVLDCVESLGFSTVFVQELSGNTDFFPDFARPRPFVGNVNA